MTAEVVFVGEVKREDYQHRANTCGTVTYTFNADSSTYKLVVEALKNDEYGMGYVSCVFMEVPEEFGWYISWKNDGDTYLNLCINDKVLECWVIGRSVGVEIGDAVEMGLQAARKHAKAREEAKAQ